MRDAALTLDGAIRSIMTQDFPHQLTEVIFVDDGSKDETLSIIQRYMGKMDMYVRVFSTEWQGLGRARNTVVNESNSDFIIWIDGDMLLPRDHVRKQIEFMKQNPNVGIAKARYGTLPDESLLAFLENVGYVVNDWLYGHRPTQRNLGTGGSIYRVESIRKAGGFDDRISGVGEDSDAEFRVRKAGWLLYLASPAFFYERRRRSIVAIWGEGFWYGYGQHYIYRKSHGILSLFRLAPLASFFVGAWYATAAYRLTYRKSVFLLPFTYSFKRLAWMFGFVAGQIGCSHVLPLSKEPVDILRV